MQLAAKSHRLLSNGSTARVWLGARLLPKVELAGVFQSTWKFHRSSWSVLHGPPLAASHDMKYGSGAPAGGLASWPPSAVDGRSRVYWLPSVNDTSWACCPASICVRS